MDNKEWLEKVIHLEEEKTVAWTLGFSAGTKDANVFFNKESDDEKHCTCVPFLRTRIKELEDKVKMYENQIKQFKKDYPFFDNDENWDEL